MPMGHAISESTLEDLLPTLWVSLSHMPRPSETRVAYSPESILQTLVDQVQRTGVANITKADIIRFIVVIALVRGVSSSLPHFHWDRRSKRTQSTKVASGSRVIMVPWLSSRQHRHRRKHSPFRKLSCMSQNFFGAWVPVLRRSRR